MFFQVNYEPSKNNKKIIALDDFDQKSEMFRLWTYLTNKCEKVKGIVYDSWACVMSSPDNVPIEAFRGTTINGTLNHPLHVVCFYIENIKDHEPCIHIYGYEQSHITIKNGELILPTFTGPKSHFILYDRQVLMKTVYNKSYNKMSGHSYPCTLADIYMYQPETSMHFILSLLMTYWGKTHLLWNDIRKDYQQPKAYGAIPIKDVWSSFNVRDLIKKQYGYDSKRINKDGLGRSVFIAKVRRYVSENELQLLYSFDPPHTKLGKKKHDISYAMADYLWKKSGCQDIHPYEVKTKTVRVRGEDRQITLRKPDIKETIDALLSLRQLIPLKIKTPKELQDLHDDTFLKLSMKNVRVVIHKDNPFRNLKLPPIYHIITSKRDLIEEGLYQHNCVGSYSKSISDGNCAIISRRDDDGERYTIEIRIKHNCFVIYQYFGFGNSDAPSDKITELEELLKDQHPAGPARKRRTKAEIAADNVKELNIS